MVPNNEAIIIIIIIIIINLYNIGPEWVHHCELEAELCLRHSIDGRNKTLNKNSVIMYSGVVVYKNKLNKVDTENSCIKTSYTLQHVVYFRHTTDLYMACFELYTSDFFFVPDFICCLYLCVHTYHTT
jgi:hypothetical protein